MSLLKYQPCADQEGSNYDVFFFFLVDKKIQIPLKAGHHRLTSETPVKWRFTGQREDYGPTSNVGFQDDSDQYC